MGIPAPSQSARAVVTGASSGIGEALATELAARGHHLIVVARRTELLNGLAERLADQHGTTVEVRGVDLADRDARHTLSAELAAREISVLCNNAGIATFGPIASQSPAGERAQVELNAVAVHDLTLAVLPGMLARGSGGILVTGSAAGNMPIPNNATYAATKAFVNSFAESLRAEVKGTGVHVTLLAPGPVRTVEPDPADASIIDRVVPDSFWVSSRYAAKLSLDALARNKMRVVPGIIGKALSTAGQYTPRAVVAPIVGSFYKKLGH